MSVTHMLRAAVFWLVFVGLPGATAAEWRVTEESSALDGRRSAIARLDSDQMAPNSIGELEPAVLVVKCRAGRVEAYVDWPRFIGLRSVRGGYRFDNDPPVMNEGFSASTDGAATFFYKGGLVRMMQRLATASRLVVRAEPRDYEPQEATWTLGDAGTVLRQVAGNC